MSQTDAQLIDAMASRLRWGRERNYRLRDSIDRVGFFIGCAEFSDVNIRDLERLDRSALAASKREASHERT